MDNTYAGPCDNCNRGMIQYYCRPLQRHIDAFCPDCDGTQERLKKAGSDLIDFLKSIGIAIPNPDGWRNR